MLFGIFNEVLGTTAIHFMSKYLSLYIVYCVLCIVCFVLKAFAKQRGENTSADKIARVTAARVANRYSSLPSLCDVLRSLARAERRIANRTSQELVEKLAPDLRISEDELKLRLALLVEHVPEFLSVFPPDDVVDVETVRINLSAPFQQVRRKLEALATASIDSRI